MSRADGSYNPSSAKRRGFEYIGLLDRSELLAYIQGSQERSEKINLEASKSCVYACIYAIGDG